MTCVHWRDCGLFRRVNRWRAVWVAHFQRAEVLPTYTEGARLGAATLGWILAAFQAGMRLERRLGWVRMWIRLEMEKSATWSRSGLRSVRLRAEIGGREERACRDGEGAGSLNADWIGPMGLMGLMRCREVGCLIRPRGCGVGGLVWRGFL